MKKVRMALSPTKWSWMGKGVRLQEAGVKGEFSLLSLVISVLFDFGFTGTGTDFVIFFSKTKRYSHIRRN